MPSAEAAEPAATDPAAAPRDVRVCFFGDSWVAGVGDPKALGWVGRVAARTPASTGIDLTTYQLGVRGEGAEEVAVRMPMECAPRFARGDEHRVVVAVGTADAWRDVEPARSAVALDFGLSALSVPALVVGPAPSGDDEFRGRLARTSDALAHVCERRGVPFVDTFTPLSGKPEWDDARAEDGMHPNQTGYGLLAYVVLHSGWYEWLGVTRPTTATTSRHAR